MFTAKDIKDLMDAKPFKPFRLCMPDGATYDVTNHDAALITRGSVQIGLNQDSDGIADRVARCTIIHINRIEDLQPA